MDNIIIKSPSSDMYGTKKENIFYACNGDKIYGKACLYPFEGNEGVEFPRNIYIGISNEDGEVLDEIKDILLEESKKRAKEIRMEKWEDIARLYACFFSKDKEKIDYFISRGFVHDAGMLIMHKDLVKSIPLNNIRGNVRVQAWNMETTEEKLKFIEAHKKCHRGQFQYSCDKIEELMKKPLWTNFTAFNGDEVVGNVMIFEETSEDNKQSVGWIEDLFVQKEWRRKGIGKQLMIQALNYFKENGVDGVSLELWSDNKRGEALYKSLGFERLKETEVAVSLYI